MIIIHGENIVASRNYLKTITDGFKGEVVRLEGNQLTFNQILQSLESQSLFEENRLVVLEKVFSLLPSKEKEKILNYLKVSDNKNAVIWEGKKIDGRVLKSFKRMTVRCFDLSPYIFKLLDSISPGNPKQSLIFFHQCLSQDPPEIIFYMLVRQFRLLIIAKDLGEKGLEKMADWQKLKLVGQAKKFTLGKLLFLHRQLLKIDYEQKTGKSLLGLVSQLDLLLVTI